MDQATKGWRSNQTPPQAGIAAVQHQQQTEPGLSVPMAKGPVLVKDVLRAVQGLKATYMQYAAGPQAYNPAAAGSGLQLAAQAELPLPEGLRTLMHELGELGLMFKRVQAAIAEGHQPGTGSVRQALCGALYEEVTDFYRLIAVLEGQLHVPPPMPGPGAAAGAGGGGAQGTYLTLRRLQLWLAEPLRRMRLLAALVDATNGMVGGQLAGRVWGASKVGDPLARGYATRILQQVCVPLFDMIRHWVFDGLLQDPGCEFFIVPNSSSTAGSSNSSSNQIPRRQQQGAVTSSSSSSVERDLWRDAYKLELAKLPPFITQELAKIIERAGKSINFLRDACGDMQWVQDWAPAAAGAAAALGYGQLPVLERVVVSASRSVDARLMEVLRSTGEWDRHCSAIRRYLLLGQGDFVVAFLDIVGPDLCKTVDTTGKADVTPQLNHLLRQALLSCSGGVRLDEEVNGPMELLRIETNKGSGSTDIYWDLFSLRYQLGPPLSSIFTPAAQAQYNRLNKLLWRLRRAERSLNDAWRSLKVDVERALPQFKQDACIGQLDDLLRFCMRLHAEMAHITTNLQYYINLEVVECAWSEFMAAAAAAPDLDCLIEAHDRFLSSVLNRALLGGGQAEALRQTLTKLLTNCMDLAGPVRQLRDKVHTGLRALDEREKQVARNTAAGAWGRADSWPPAVPPEDLAWIKDTLRSTEQRHCQLRQALLKGLPAAANEVNAEVRFLLARLDFTNFYKEQ